MAPTKRDDYTAKDMGLRSDSFAVELPDNLAPRIIANVEAKQKVGKTYFSLATSPGPTVVFNFDQGLEGVVEPLRRKGKQIIIAGVPTKDPRMYPSYHFARPVPNRGQSTKNEEYLTRVKKEAVGIWERFINDYKEALESRHVRTLVIDTGGGAFQLGKFAFHGMDKVTSKDDPYGQKGGELKSIFQGLITDGYNYDKNVLWLHRLKEEWKGGSPNGTFIADGYNQVAYEVQVTLRLGKKVTRGETARWVEVRDSRLDTQMEGEEFAGKQCRFSTVAALLTGTDEDVWE